MPLDKQSQSPQGIIPVQNGRLSALKAKHAALSTKIEKEARHSFHSESLIAQLKKEKLLLKEKIEGLRDVS
jgi:hypothetical protein